MNYSLFASTGNMIDSFDDEAACRPRQALASSRPANNSDEAAVAPMVGRGRALKTAG